LEHDLCADPASRSGRCILPAAALFGAPVNPAAAPTPMHLPPSAAGMRSLADHARSITSRRHLSTTWFEIKLRDAVRSKSGPDEEVDVIGHVIFYGETRWCSFRSPMLVVVCAIFHELGAESCDKYSWSIMYLRSLGS